MIQRNGKEFYNEVEMMTFQEKVVEASKMPRVAVTPVVFDTNTGYINAAPYSGGVISRNPLKIAFGVKSYDGKRCYETAEEFTVCLAARKNVCDLWITTMAVPHGISEIDVAGLTELPSQQITTPGIEEYPIVLECKPNKVIKLGGVLRNIVIADVIGISIDKDFYHLSRAESVMECPIHEAIQRHPDTNTYALSAIDSRDTNDWAAEESVLPPPEKNGRYYVGKDEMYLPKYKKMLSLATFPMPDYLLTVNDADNVYTEAIEGGILMHTKPAIQIPVDKDSKLYQLIKETQEFTVSIPGIKDLEKYKQIKCTPGNPEKYGFTLEKSEQISAPGISECRVVLECKVYSLDEIPDSNKVFVLAKKVGMQIDSELVESRDYISLYADYIYSVEDVDGSTKYCHQSKEFLPIKAIPFYGSSLNGGWWGGPEEWQAGFHFWLIELLNTNRITAEEYHKLKRWISWWRSEGYPAPEPLKSQIRERLTEALKLMAIACKDMTDSSWTDVHEFFNKFDYEGAWGC